MLIVTFADAELPPATDSSLNFPLTFPQDEKAATDVTKMTEYSNDFMATISGDEFRMVLNATPTYFVARTEIR
jgi:hypothetical protein